MNETKATVVARDPHHWHFFRAGGFDQVRLDSGADLLALDQLDQKLWVALSCPTRGLEFDQRTLNLIDTDHDGRIRVPEVVAAVKWAGSLLRNPDDLTKGAPALPLSAIADHTAEGQQILASAREILAGLGKRDAAAITAEDTADTARIFAQMRFNGDGIVPPESAGDECMRAAITDILKCVAGDADRGGKPGLSLAKLEQFLKDAQAYSDWWAKAEQDPAIRPLGDATAAAGAALNAVRAKIDDYFMRCRVAAFDARAAGPLNRAEADYAVLAAKELTAATAELRALPLAQVAPGKALPLADGLNPAWAAAVAACRSTVLQPLLGVTQTLTAEQWAAVTARFAAHDAWSAAKAGAAVEALGVPRVRELLAPAIRDGIAALIAQDRAKEPEANAIAAVDRLVRYHRDLYQLLNNFVSFRDFYSRQSKAVFQAGTLYLDGRSCDLCIRVDDLSRHGMLAGLSRLFLAYCECRRPDGADKLTIAAAFTGGDSDFLLVGRNGVFYDRQGRDWDATIVKVVEHPISIGQAFWMPYKRVARLIGEQFEKFTAGREQAVQDKAATTAAAAVQKAGSGKSAAAPAPFDVAKFAGIFAAIGLAVGAIGTAIAAVVTGFLSLHWWQMPLALAGLVIVVSGPAMALAWLKLRQRNLGPLLDASGWAVNARAKLNLPFGESLTATAKLPAGAVRSLDDAFAEKKSVWPYAVLVLAVLAAVLFYLNHTGQLHEWTGWGKQVAPPVTAPAAPAPAAPAPAPTP